MEDHPRFVKLRTLQGDDSLKTVLLIIFQIAYDSEQLNNKGVTECVVLQCTVPS